MSSQQLTISLDVDAAIRQHGQETYPHECCGALVGRDGVVSAIVALPNTTDEGPRRRFMVRPSDYQLAERRAVAALHREVTHEHDRLGSHPEHLHSMHGGYQPPASRRSRWRIRADTVRR